MHRGRRVGGREEPRVVVRVAAFVRIVGRKRLFEVSLRRDLITAMHGEHCKIVERSTHLLAVFDLLLIRDLRALDRGRRHLHVGLDRGTFEPTSGRPHSRWRRIGCSQLNRRGCLYRSRGLRRSRCLRRNGCGRRGCLRRGCRALVDHPCLLLDGGRLGSARKLRCRRANRHCDQQRLHDRRGEPRH